MNCWSYVYTHDEKDYPEFLDSLSLKIIFMSGYTDGALVQDGVLEEHRALQKPFSLKTVLDAIQQLYVAAQS